MWASEGLVPVLQVCPRFLGRSSREGRITCQELKEDASKGPVVDGEAVALATHALDRHVVRRADYGICSARLCFADAAIDIFHLLGAPVDDVGVLDLVELVLHRFDATGVQIARGESEVGKLYVARFVDQEVLGITGKERGRKKSESRICWQGFGLLDGTDLWLEIPVDVTELV